ncbi:MAG TPA: ABC transporter substrate-binding protein [Acidimicrobiales bacterium]|jgi:branched-chain amino acid transport system substrate-binding protein
MKPSGKNRPRTRSRIGLAALAGALLISGAGCATQESDSEIAAALQGPSSGSATAPVVAGNTNISVQPSGPDAAALDTAGSGQAPAASSGGSGAGSAPTITNTATASSAGPRAGGGSSNVAAAQPKVARSSVVKGVGRDSGNATAAQPKVAHSSVVKGVGGGSGNGAAAQPKVANKSVVKIGTIGPYSGVLGAIFADGPRTLSAWATYANSQGGLNGHPVKVIVGDDQGDPATSQTLVRRMVESDKIIAMVANTNIFGFEQLQKYTQEKGIPLIGGDGVHPAWFTAPNSFPTAAPVAQQIIKGLDYLIQKRGASKIAILYCLEVSALCTYLTNEVKKSEIGKYIVQDYQVSLVAPSYTSQCLRMKQAGVDTLYLMMDTAGGARALQDCANQGFKPTTMLLSLNATSQTVKMPALANLLVIGATFPPASSGTPAIELYNKVLSTYAPSVEYSGATSFAWAGAQMLDLVGKNLSENPTSAELFEALWTVKNETLGGLIVPTTFAKGKPPEVQRCVFLWGIANSTWSAPQGLKPLC